MTRGPTPNPALKTDTSQSDLRPRALGRLARSFRRRNQMRVLLVALAGLTVGCMPWPTLVQPGIEFRVVTADASPIHDATVTLARYSVSMLPKEHIESLVTDTSGVASFSGERKWQLHIAAPDLGGALYSWSWCVEAVGFMPVFENDLRSSGYSSVEDVTLEHAESAHRCHWQCYPCAFGALPE